MLIQVLAALTLAGTPSAPLTRVPTVADPIRGLDLWRGAKVGMGVAEVGRLFPAAVPPTTPTVLTGGELDRLQLSGVELDGRPAIARFFFKGPELTSVELNFPGLRPAASETNIALVKQVASHLGLTYGQGYDCGDKSSGNIDVYECKWLRGPLSVRLWYMDVAGQAPLFYLAFRQASDPSYNL